MSYDSVPTAENSLLEGFLCPFCIQDLGDVLRLQSHVQTCHKSGVPPGEAFKGFLGRAKQKIFKTDKALPCSDVALASLVENSGADLEANNDKSSNSVHPARLLHIQEPGTSRSHNRYFFECRGHYIDETTVQTNNLIMRLDKLINQGPLEGYGRKDFEKETVSWLADSEVKNCQICLAAFHPFSRRRHHCRLCGSIMCSTCSVFLTFAEARRLINPVYDVAELGSLSLEDSKKDLEDNPAVTSSFGSSLMSVLKSKRLITVREKSEKLVFSTFSRQKKNVAGDAIEKVNKTNNNEKLRLCASCFNFLNKWKEKVERIITPHPIVPLYEELCCLLHEIHRLAPSYLRMAESLNKGETLYTLELAAQLRQKINVQQWRIDTLSSKIECLGVNDSNLKVTQREMDLQKQIRCFVIQTMQELVWELSPLPSEEDFKRLQEKRRAEVAKEAELEYKSHYSSSSPALQSLSSIKKETTFNCLVGTSLLVEARQQERDQGWVPGFNIRMNPFDDEAEQIDPLEEQMFNIKGFLNQAIKDGRLEEVHMLEKNLKDLQEELDRRKATVTSESEVLG